MRRVLTTVPAAFLIAGLFVAAPAAAQGETCATTPAQIRTVAATADAETAKRALRYVSVGEKLCDAGNQRAAGKKFAAAMKALNVESASLPAAVAAK
jgi:hypothetical protein